MLAGAAIAVAVLAIYARALSAFFFEDDFQWLVSRWTFHPADLLTLEARYKPVFELYWWAATSLFDRSPFAYHAASIAIHIVNGWLILAIASRLGMPRLFAFVTAMLFVVQPAYVHAVAWIGAVAEALVLLFGCSSILALLRFRTSGNARWLWLATGAFAVALFCHESAIVFLPLLMLCDRIAHADAWRWPAAARVYWPFASVAAAYLALTFSINTPDYLTGEIGYSAGPHVVRNVFEYIASLYVGERKLVSHLVAGAVLLLVIAVGRPRARLGVAWLLLGILPFAPFHIGNISRYAYVPAAGLAFLMGEGLLALAGALRRRRVVSAFIVGVLALAVTVRFAYFARDGVKDVTNASERYRQFLAELRQKQPLLPDHAVVYVSAEHEQIMPRRFVEAAVQWEYRNPTLRVEVRR